MQNEKGKHHGYCPRGKRSPTYNIWNNLMRKCRREGVDYDPVIGVFSAFLSLMGERPDGHSLERIDDTAGYRPENLHWVKRWHGKTMTSEYFIWSGMIARCEDSNCPAYHDYGGRGIRVHPSLRTFDGFLSVLGPKPSQGHTLDRWPNNDGNYEPGNVRWATRTQQARNQRSNRHITFNGRTQLLCEWAAELGIKAITLSRRIDAGGWSIEEALTSQKFRHGVPKLTESDVLAIYNASGTPAEIASRFGVAQSHASRIRRGLAWASLTQAGSSPRPPRRIVSRP